MKSLWLQHVKTWRESGLSQAEYCRQNGVNQNTFSGWIKRESRLDTHNSLKVIPIKLTPSAAASVPVGLVLRFSHGAQLEFSSSVSPLWLAELLRCL